MEDRLPCSKEDMRETIIVISEHCPAEYGLKNIVKNCKTNDVENCLACWFQALL